MAELQECVGINITDSGIAVACVERSGSEASLDICEYKMCATEDQLPSTMDRLAQELDLFDRPCVLALEPRYYELFLVESVEFDEENKVEKLEERVGDLLDFPVEKAVLEYVELPGEDGEPGRMAYIIAAQKDKIDEQAKMVCDVGLDLVAVDIAETGMRNIASALSEAESGTLYVHLHPEGSQMVLVRQSTIGMMRSIELDVSCLFPGEDAELENNAIMREVLVENLSGEIERSLNYSTTTLGQEGVSQVVIAPMKADMAEMIPQIEEKTGMKIRMMDLSESVEFSQEMMVEHQQRCLLAVGAAMREEVA